MEQPLTPQPLSDLRVIDLTHGIAGPYCTKLLADFGADVIKVERPGAGDWSRSLGPFPGDVPHTEKSGLFLFLNTNKRSVVLDLETRQGVEVVKELVRSADVLVEGFRPGVMERLGLSYEVVSKINTNLVMTSLSNFGQTGPYRDYLASELTLYAMGHSMNAPVPDRYPLKLGGNHVQFQAGNVAAMASLFAWYAQRYQGLGGQYLDVSIFETQMASINGRMAALIQYQYLGRRVKPPAGGGGLGYPSGSYPTQDGYVTVTGGGAYWARTVAALGMPELLNDPRFAPPLGQLSAEGREEFEGTIWLPWLLERTKQQAMADLQAHEIYSGVLNSLDEVVDSTPQLASRGYIVEIDHPVAGKLRYPGSPLYTPKGWWRIHRPAPLLGQHTQEVLKEANSRPKAAERLAKAPAATQPQGTKRLPLEGIRVIDMTVVWAGTYGTMFLADMGAEVIRVESVNVFPNATRGFFAHPDKEAEKKRPTSNYPNWDPGDRAWNRANIFNQHARNKLSMTVDVNTPEGKGVFRRLVEVSDLFIENNVIGSMERLGVTYDVVSQWNPRLIMISATGFGRTGPWAHYRGFGSAFEATYGHMSVVGYPDMDAEGKPGSVASDASTGVTIALAAMMALNQRERTGKGCYVDISMGENFLPHLGELIMDYTINGRVAGTMGNRDPHLVQGVYSCTGDDEWLAVSLGAIEQWHALCRVMGRPELIEDKRFSDWQALQAHHDEVDEIMSAWTKDKNSYDLFHRLQTAGVPAGPMMHEVHAFNDPHVKERDFFVEITAPEVGTHLYPSTAFKMSKTPFVVRKPPVRLGEDNDYIYQKVLKLSDAEYRHLQALGQVGMDFAPNVP
ncbi:MAG: CoA transferase [Dehalococcoidia bacterium]|nr:CoA transferase [Dehalococcoidia bacterium]